MATVTEVLYHGAMRRVELQAPFGPLVASVPATGASLAEGAPVQAVFPRAAIHLMESA